MAILCDFENLSVTNILTLTDFLFHRSLYVPWSTCVLFKFQDNYNISCNVASYNKKYGLFEGRGPRVISRGLRVAESPLLTSVFIWGVQPPKTLFLPKCYDQLCTAIWLLRHFLLLTILYQY